MQRVMGAIRFDSSDIAIDPDWIGVGINILSINTSLQRFLGHRWVRNHHPECAGEKDRLDHKRNFACKRRDRAGQEHDERLTSVA
jgi:hypothetical protein